MYRRTEAGLLVGEHTAPGPVWLGVYSEVYSSVKQCTHCGAEEETLWHQSQWSEPEERSSDQTDCKDVW